MNVVSDRQSASSSLSNLPENLPLVSLSKGLPVVASMQVAEYFEKEHKNVLRDIRRIISETPDAPWTELNFELISYSTDLGHTTRQDPMYLITREGFMVLGMGFTGHKAMAMKIAFIKAFAAMERELAALRGTPAKSLDDLGLSPSARRLSAQQKVLLMNNATQIAKAEDRVSDVKQIWAELCNAVADGTPQCAVNAAQHAQESVRLFAKQCCEASENPSRRVLLSVVYAAYASWCGVQESHYTPVAQHRFMDLLRRHMPGVYISRPRDKRVGGRYYSVSGLVLLRASGMF